MTRALARQVGIELFVVAAFGLVLGVFGPFGSFAMPLLPRLLYWVCFLLGGYGFFRPLIVVGGWLSEAFALPRWLGTGLALSLAAVPVSLMVLAMLNGFNFQRLIASDVFVTVYLEVLLIGALVQGLFHLLGQRGLVAAAAPALPEPIHAGTAEPAFARRLPPGFGPLIALAGEDHYVRAIAADRDTLVLVRMRDAVAELAGIEGMQVHRSWWVAREAVHDTRREGRALTLVLENGREVPVARDKIPALRQAGWL